MGKGPATGRRFGSIILGVACLGVAAGRLVGLRQAHRFGGERAGWRNHLFDRVSVEGAGAFGPAHSTLRVAEGREGECPPRPFERPSRRLGLPAERSSRRDRRRVRELAPRARCGRRGRLDPAEHALRQAHRHGGAVAPGPGRAALRCAQQGGGLVAKVGAGVVGEVSNCTGEWCEVTAGGYDGWIEQTSSGASIRANRWTDSRPATGGTIFCIGSWPLRSLCEG